MGGSSVTSARGCPSASPAPTSASRSSTRPAMYLAPAAPAAWSWPDGHAAAPFGDRSFDLVYTQGSLMHVPPPGDRAYRAELARVARRFVVHTEDVQETESTFAHDNAGHYRETRALRAPRRAVRAEHAGAADALPGVRARGRRLMRLVVIGAGG